MIYALRVITSFLLFVFTNEVVAQAIFNQTEILLLFSEQDTTIDNAEKEKVIIVDPQSPPTFKDGGDAGMQKFIQENLKYPQGESANGTVYVNVTVDATGEGRDYIIAKGLSPTTDEEALRVVKLMKFNPGTFNGIPKEMKLRIPIKFEVVPSMEQAPLFKGSIVESSLNSNSKTKKDSIFTAISNYPEIPDTTKFISELLEFCDIDRESSYIGQESITFFQKVKIYGSKADYILIEYEYAEGSGASYPWKYQFIFTSEGTLVETMSALRFEWISIFKNENPFLLTLTSTSKGNGFHNIYKITSDTLENVLDNDLDYFLRTYDAHEENTINQPNEMRLLIEDRNADGINDISFVGKIVLIQIPIGEGEWIDGEVIDGKTIDYSVSNPFKEMNVEFVFLFDRQTGHFKMKEDYNLKYQELK